MPKESPPKPSRRRSSVTDFKLVPVDARRDQQRRLLFAGAGLLLLIVGLGIGLALGAGSPALWHAGQQDKIAALETQSTDLRQQLAVFRTDKTINSEAQDKVQQQLKEQRDQLAELQEAVSFYKSIMDPADRDQGLHIEHLQLQPKGQHRYAFRLVLSQVGNNKFRPYLSGNVSWQLVGTQNGKPVTLSQQVFVTDDSENDFRFRYFQELNGSLTLPADVVPQKLVISAVSDGQRAYQAQHTFNWTSVEHTNNAGS